MSVSPALASLPATSPIADGGCAVADAPVGRGHVTGAATHQRLLVLAARSGPDTLRDAELLALHLGPSDRRAGMGLAERLVDRFGGLAGVLGASPAELRRHVEPDTISAFKMLREVAERLVLGGLARRESLSSFSAVTAFFRVRLRGLPHEEVWAAFLDKKNHLIVVERLGRGTVDHAPVYVREVMARALECGASAMVLAHNHPSGDPTPSREDIAMTKSLAQAGKVLGVTIHDHVVIGAEGVVSFRASGLL
ncbi:DNA repair protein RadC [Caulobacter sp.]|uniref:JAB domain-containing protein n=1 Tax=Caulobacter sp. TaxID=78 RepID=UPI001B0B7FC2|nr:DNA repair protein RadC [Caulobacter sp.]MBO9547124.1 DNA repair protein RadC [Caulobacter sp.]